MTTFSRVEISGLISRFLLFPRCYIHYSFTLISLSSSLNLPSSAVFLYLYYYSPSDKRYAGRVQDLVAGTVHTPLLSLNEVSHENKGWPKLVQHQSFMFLNSSVWRLRGTKSLMDLNLKLILDFLIRHHLWPGINRSPTNQRQKSPPPSPTEMPIFWQIIISYQWRKVLFYAPLRCTRHATGKYSFLINQYPLLTQG